jgi:hypothetical protein
MLSHLHGELMTWQFIDYDDIDGGYKLQVEQYPVLTLSRTSLIIQNRYFYMSVVLLLRKI